MLTDEIHAVCPPVAQGPDALDATACADLTEKIDGARSPALPLAFGQTLGKCLVTEVLGSGGWCTVFRGLHQSLNINVAVKVLNLSPDDPYLPQARAQLCREAQLLARIHHPHVVRVFDFHDDARQPFLVLECVDGPSLRDLIVQNGRLHAKRARALMRQVAHGLAVIGALGAVHRDIKPANILLTRDGNAKIADFGQVALVQPAEGPPSRSGTEVTGTVAYMAPEQFLTDGDFDQRSDLYSLGVTFYEAVTGRLPFLGHSRMEILLKHAEEQPVPPCDLVPDLEPGLSELILMLLAKNPDDRPRNAAEVCAALSPVRPASPPPMPALETSQLPAPALPIRKASELTPEQAVTPPPPERLAAIPDDRTWWSALRDWLGVRPHDLDQENLDRLWLKSMQRTLFPPAHRNPKSTVSS